MTRCGFCMHPKREEYERKIVSKELSMSRVAQLMNCNKSSVSRHMSNCFPKKIAEWVKPEATKEEALNVIKELVCSHRDLLDLYEEARATGNIDAAIRALGEERKHLEIVAKLTGQLQERSSVSIFLSPEYLELKQVINATLAPFPEVRQKLAEAFSKVANDGGRQ